MTSDDDRLAAGLAREAGNRLLALRAGGGDPSQLRKAGDRLSHEFLTAQLAARRPGDAVLSEEGRDDPARLSADRVWIVDPLDGTREFGEPERTDWAVHVALWERGRLTAGAVALPAQGQVLATLEPPPPPPGPAANGAGGPPPGPLRLLVSRTRPAEFMPRLAELVNGTMVPLGSAGAKAAVVIRGEAEAYVHGGGQYEWDSAAPAAVALAAGLHASRLDGSPLQYNQPDPVLPDILICQAALAGTLLDAISAAVAARP
jgi:3'(2'), 5'-bisphosphate nucleotidase